MVSFFPSQRTFPPFPFLPFSLPSSFSSSGTRIRAGKRRGRGWLVVPLSPPRGVFFPRFSFSSLGRKRDSEGKRALLRDPLPLLYSPPFSLSFFFFSSFLFSSARARGYEWERQKYGRRRRSALCAPPSFLGAFNFPPLSSLSLSPFPHRCIKMNGELIAEDGGRGLLFPPSFSLRR